MNEVTRHFCWHQNFVPGGCLPLPWCYIHYCIKSWKKLYKIGLQRHFFWNLQQINVVTRHFCWHQNFVPVGCLPLPCVYIQATLVISTPDNSILSLIPKWNKSPNIFLYIVIAFQLWISQSMDNLKLWISESGFSVPNCKLSMFILLLISKCKLLNCQSHRM